MVEALFILEHIQKMRPSIQKTVDTLLEAMIPFAGTGPVDLVDKFALPVPSYTIYGILGVPLKDLPFLTQAAANRINGSATASEALNANASLLSYIAKLVDERSLSSKDDLISHLVTKQVIPGHITKETAVQIAFLLLVAGNATMVSMIALGVVELLKHPDQLDQLKQDPDQWASPFVEELCRYHTASALATKRVAKEGIVLGGKAIKKGEGIIAATMSGNRDEDVFLEPDVFDMTRKRGKEEALGFGWGEHRFVAEWLARAELEIVFGEFDESVSC
jgi:nitric oxide reductase